VAERSTTSVVTSSGIARADVEALSERLKEPVWLRERRLEAWEAFEHLPLPSATHQEEWRRTDIAGLDIGAFALPHGGGAAAPGHALAGDARERTGFLVHADGSSAQVELDEAVDGQGVIFADLSNAATSHPDLVREHLFRTMPGFDEHKFRALHAAFWSGGTFVYVPRGVEVTLPLVAHSHLSTSGAALFPHTLVVAEAGSRVTVIDLYTSNANGERTLACGVNELILGDAAQVRYVAVQEWGASMWEVGSVIRAHLARDATLHSLVVGLGGGLVKVDVESQLFGQGASSEMLGVYFGAAKQHFDFHTLQEHRAPSTMSELLYKGAVTDHAHTVFAGLIRVDWGAQKTNAFQANRNLILSATARSDSIPKLEIMANDLRCTHGSATSRLNEEHIFYLMSRGLSRDQATHMIVEGFFADIFDRIPIERVRAHLEQRIAEKMAGRV